MTRLDAIQGVVGLLLIAAGLSLVSIPAALVVVGAVLLILGLGPAFTTTKPRRM